MWGPYLDFLYNPGYFLSSALDCAALAEAIPFGEISFWYCLAAASPVAFLGIGDLEAFDGDFRLGLETETFGLLLITFGLCAIEPRLVIDGVLAALPPDVDALPVILIVGFFGVAIVIS